MNKLLFLPVLFAVVASDSCVKKFYPKATSFVCVCNSEKCDSLPKVESVIDDDSVLVFESNAEKYRFHKQVRRLENSSARDGPYHPHHPQAVITIHATKTDQTILGFGAGFTDSAGINLRTLDEKLQRHLIQDYFDQEGLEMNMARVPIGGCDCSNRNYTLDDYEDDFELEKFSLTEDDFNYKIPYILMAKNMSKNLRLWGSSWSSPIWMKTNHAIDGLGILIEEPGQFYWKLYAKYIIKFLDAYKSHGIDFWGLTTANEPGIGLIPYMGWNQLGFSPEMMREWIKKDLGPALKNAGYGRDKLKLMMLDDNLNDMQYHVETVLRDEEAAQYIDGISFHWYATRYMGSWDVIRYIHEKFPDKFMMMTEACGVGGVLFGDWGRGEAYSIDIIEDLNHGSVGWADWNLALDPQGGPNWARAWNDASIIVNGSISEYYRQPTFYSLAHFTKFLHPGSVRIHHTLITKRSGIRTTVFRNTDGNFVLVLLNTDGKAANVVIKGFREKDFKTEIGPHSIQTYVTKFHRIK